MKDWLEIMLLLVLLVLYAAASTTGVHWRWTLDGVNHEITIGGDR